MCVSHTHTRASTPTELEKRKKERESLENPTDGGEGKEGERSLLPPLSLGVTDRTDGEEGTEEGADALFGRKELHTQANEGST